MSHFSQRLSHILKGDPRDLRPWLEEPNRGRLLFCFLFIILGFSFYGLSVGLWRAPQMGFFVALKMPLLVFLTLACNGLLNGIFGLLLGSGLGFRQSLLALLMSFTIAAAILGALAPVTFFMALNAPPPEAENAHRAHALYLLTHTLLIAYAGIIANLHLARLLLAHCPDKKTAGLTLAAWLGGNAFVGAQFSWILRPFFGSPGLEVAFLRDDPMRGTFYETVWRSLERVAGSYSIFILFILAMGGWILLTPLFSIFNKQKPKQ